MEGGKGKGFRSDLFGVQVGKIVAFHKGQPTGGGGELGVI